MIKLHITWVGQPKAVTTKFGNKEKFSIKATEYGDAFIDVWSSPQTKGWQVGQEVEVESVDSKDYNGKTYLSVRMPKVDNRPQGFSSDTTKQIASIHLDMGQVLMRIKNIETYFKHLKDNVPQLTSAGTPVPDFTQKTMNQKVDENGFVDYINPDDIPF